MFWGHVLPPNGVELCACIASGRSARQHRGRSVSSAIACPPARGAPEEGQMGSTLMGSLQIRVLFDRDVFWYSRQLCFPNMPGHTFFQSAQFIAFAGDPLVLTPFVRDQAMSRRCRAAPRRVELSQTAPRASMSSWQAAAQTSALPSAVGPNPNQPVASLTAPRGLREKLVRSFRVRAKTSRAPEVAPRGVHGTARQRARRARGRLSGCRCII